MRLFNKKCGKTAKNKSCFLHFEFVYIFGAFSRCHEAIRSYFLSEENAFWCCIWLLTYKTPRFNPRKRCFWLQKPMILASKKSISTLPGEA